MARTLFNLILVFSFLAIAPLTNAQSRYRFYTLGMEQGLSSDFVWAVCKDKYNYVWIGTQNGLNRYDGHKIKQYFHSNKDSFSIPGNTIYWMYKDADGDMWFCFGWQGLAKYNYAKDRFEKFAPFDSIKRKNNYAAPLWRICHDLQGRLYFACGGAVFRWTKNSRKMEDLTPLFDGAIDGYGVGMFIPQNKDVLWVLTGNGLFKYDLKENAIRHMPFDKEKFGFGEKEMHDGEFINDHELLVSVVRTGFVLFDTRTETFSMPPEPVNPSRSKKFSETGGVLKDSKGRMWMANSHYGLLEYFPATNTTYSLKNEGSYPYPFAEQEGKGMNVYEDEEGNIWYSSSAKGVIWFKPETDYIQIYQRDYSKAETLPDNSVSFFQPLKNKMLIGTAKGIAVFDKKTNSIKKKFPVALNDKDAMPHPSIRGMTAHGDSVFITTARGLSIYDAAAGKFARFIDDDPLFESSFTAGQWLIHYLNGELLISGNHFSRFNTSTKKYRYYNSFPADTFYKLNDINASFLDEAEGVLWLEAGIGKLFSFNLRTKKLTEHHYTEDSVSMIDAIKKDEDGNIWIGSSEGLYCYDPSTRQGRKIPLNTSGKEVYNIAVQNNRHVWLSTPKEIIRYNKTEGTSEILASNTFLPNSSILKRAFLFDEDEHLWVGTNKGFGRIDTRRFRTKTIDAEPQLVNFSVFDKTKSFDIPLSDIEKITLKHDENFFAFDLSSFNFQTQSYIEYRYMLDGFDKDWQTAHGNSGSYTNVPPGTYYLRLKSNTGAGGWIEKQTPIVVRIQPAFWQTWWFMTLLAIGVAILILSFYRYSLKRKRKKKIDETIDYFANSLYGDNSITEICWDIARNCISQLKLEDCVVYLFDDRRNVLVQKAAYGPKNPKEHEIINPIEIKIGEGIVGTAALTKKPVLVKDTTKDSRYILDDDHRLSELAVPIVHEGKAIGVIDSEHPKRNFFTEDHVKALSTIAAISANKIAEAKAEEAAKESEMQLLEIKKLLAESQLMALRAQMNPHFVFNCLNSIQECIVTEKYSEASLYLNKFSKLFRSVLNNSGKVLITLAEEIEVLELYLALEHMRFEKSFSYNIDIQEDLETDEIMIPSMLLQPYVENALWHGLMHKEGNRQLNIYFKKANEEVLQCIVDDNGIGRQKAMELKEQQSKTKRHVSKGMRISQDRIELLQKQGQYADLKIIDKLTEDGQAAGTRVMVELSSFLQ